jgi:hypothetical protein
MGGGNVGKITFMLIISREQYLGIQPSTHNLTFTGKCKQKFSTPLSKVNSGLVAILKIYWFINGSI